MNPNLSDKRIAVAVADESLRNTLGTSLKRESATIILIATAEDLWIALDQFRPELCLVDLDLPGLTRSDLTDRIGRRRSGPVPVIVVSADPLRSQRGAMDGWPVLSIPFGHGELLGLLSRYLPMSTAE